MEAVKTVSRPTSRLRPWLTFTNWALSTTSALFLVLASLNTYTALQHNSPEDSCRYVRKGEWYQLRLQGSPCRITRETLILFIVTYLVPAAPIQGPLFLLYYGLKRLSRRGSTA